MPVRSQRTAQYWLVQRIGVDCRRYVLGVFPVQRWDARMKFGAVEYPSPLAIASSGSDDVRKSRSAASRRASVSNSENDTPGAALGQLVSLRQWKRVCPFESIGNCLEVMAARVQRSAGQFISTWGQMVKSHCSARPTLV
jgi:hypothetical protein